MLRSLVALSCLATATAFTAPSQTSRPALLRLRGGDGEIGAVVVPLSAVIGGATGVSMYLGTERITKILWLGLNKFPHDKYIGMAMIGWAMGKIAAVREGPEATKHYVQLNCIPLLLWLITNFRGSAPLTTSIIPFLLFSGYVYTGFIE